MNWKAFFDSLGLNGTRWQWRIMRWEERWKARLETGRAQRKQVAYRHKFCSCGALMDREEKTCPRCGKRAPSWHLQAANRAFGLLVPTGFSVATALLMVNLLFFALLGVFGGWSAWLQPPLALLARMGGLVLSFVPQGGYPLLITYGYLHFGILHIVFNMLVLSQVGPMLEREIGSARFFVLYTLALIGGGLMRYAVSGPVPTVVVGASGALFGLIGFGLSYAHAIGTSSSLQLRNFFAQWALYGFLFGLFVGADNMAHLGGFLVGLGLGLVIQREQATGSGHATLWQVAASISLLATVAAFVWVWIG